jgi:hypothetical protein
MPAADECWFDHERLEVYQEAIRMLMGLIKRNSTREYDKGNAAK